MNGRQRVTAAINRFPLDRIPRGELTIDKDFMQKLMAKNAGYTTAGPDLELEFLQRLDLDLICLPYKQPAHRTGDCPVDACRIKHFAEAGFFVFLLLSGSFQAEANREGLLNVLKGAAGRPELLGAALRAHSKQIVELIKQGAANGAHGILIADDIAYNRGTYMAPEFIKKWLLPCWLEQTKAAGEVNLPAFFHTDGNINAVLPLLIEAGFNGLQCLEPAAGMDIGKVKQEYGSHFCLMGNIDPVLLSDDVVAPGDTVSDRRYPELTCAVNDLIAAAAPGGGFVFGTCSGLHAGLSTEKVLHMFNLAQKNNDYKGGYCDF